MRMLSMVTWPEIDLHVGERSPLEDLQLQRARLDGNIQGFLQLFDQHAADLLVGEPQNQHQPGDQCECDQHCEEPRGESGEPAQNPAARPAGVLSTLPPFAHGDRLYIG
jgi:hypothetical protein